MSQVTTAADRFLPATRKGNVPHRFAISKRKAALLAFCVLLSVHAAFRGIQSDYDAHAYADLFDHLSSLSFRDFRESIQTDSLYYSIGVFRSYEIGFAVLSYAISRLSSEHAWYFFTLCFISLYLKALVIERLSVAPWLSVLWYCSWYYMLLEMNAVRAGLAAGILLLGARPLLEKKYIRFYVCVLAATLFHASSLAASVLPVVAAVRLRPRAMLGVLAASVACGFVDLSQPLVAALGVLNSKIVVYHELLTMTGQYAELNRFNVVACLRVFVLVLLLWNYDEIVSASSANGLWVKLYLVSIVAYFVFGSFPVIGSRLYELLGVYQILGVGALVAGLRRKALVHALVVTICVAQFYALAYHSRIVDFFYFVGKPHPIEPQD